MKKLIVIVLALVLMFGLLCACAPKSKDSSSETYIYTEYGDGTCAYYVNKNKRETLPSVLTVSETAGDKALRVTVIDEAALMNAATVTEVVLPDSVIGISYAAFKGCSALAKVNMPASLQKIDREAFRGTALTAVVLPDSLKELGGYAFADCKSLEEVVIPASVTRIGLGVFDGCDALKSVTFNGTQEQWNAVLRPAGEDALAGMTVTFAG